MKKKYVIIICCVIAAFVMAVPFVKYYWNKKSHNERMLGIEKELNEIYERYYSYANFLGLKWYQCELNKDVLDISFEGYELEDYMEDNDIDDMSDFTHEAWLYSTDEKADNKKLYTRLWINMYNYCNDDNLTYALLYQEFSDEANWHDNDSDCDNLSKLYRFKCANKLLTYNMVSPKCIDMDVFVKELDKHCECNDIILDFDNLDEICQEVLQYTDELCIKSKNKIVGIGGEYSSADELIDDGEPKKYDSDGYTEYYSKHINEITGQTEWVKSKIEISYGCLDKVLGTYVGDSRKGVMDKLSGRFAIMPMSVFSDTGNEVVFMRDEYTVTVQFEDDICTYICFEIDW